MMVWPAGMPSHSLGKGKRLAFVLANVGHQGDDCLIYPFGRAPTGYAYLEFNRRTWLAHRLMCQLVHGEPPTPAHEAAHSCGNGHMGCVNPKHLSWKTRTENQRDRYIHNRKPRPISFKKLNNDQVEQIRILSATTTRADLAKRFNVARSTIRSVLLGVTWGADRKRIQRDFTRDDIIRIREGRRKIPAKKLAEEFGIGIRTVRAIQYRESYGHVR